VDPAWLKEGRNRIELRVERHPTSAPLDDLCFGEISLVVGG